MLTWRTVGMHVPSSFSSAICVQRMQESRRTAPAKMVQVYTCIYMYIRVYLGFTCISWVVCQLRQLKIGCKLTARVTGMKVMRVELRLFGGTRRNENDAKWTGGVMVNLNSAYTMYILVYTSITNSENSISQSWYILSFYCVFSLYSVQYVMHCIGYVSHDTETSWNYAPVWKKFWCQVDVYTCIYNMFCG